MRELKLRSLFKAITWRIIAFTITSSLAYLFTHKPFIAVSIGFLDSFIKIFAYFLHERTWLKIRFGVSPHPLEEFPVKRPLSEKDKEAIKEKLKKLGYLD